MKVKICGIRRLEDALLAVECGAWALGFVFHRPSARWIEPGEARRIAEALLPRVLTVGVFVDRPLDEVQRVVEEVGLGGVQLHGSESPEYASRVRAGTVIKAFRVGPGFPPSSPAAYPGCRILLDAWDPALAGGTGRVTDWSLAARVARERPIILAGGLNPRNVATAISLVGPDAIDVSSGLESAPGVKDPEAIRGLFRAISGGRIEDPRA